MRYDLHIHSALSPCADDDMTPQAIAGMAMLAGLSAFALTDHNSALNCPAAAHWAGEYGLIFVPGIEVTTSEEIHAVCLFPTVGAALDFSRVLRGRLPDFDNDPAIFGEQLIFDPRDEIAGRERIMLSNATDLSLCDLRRDIARRGAFCFPAHVDRPSYSVLSSLGAFPPECDFRTAEVSRPERLPELAAAHPEMAGMRILTNSDAHTLSLVGDNGGAELPLPAGVADAAALIRCLLESEPA